MKTLTEGNITFKAHTQKIVSSDMPVFYNPVQVINRDISVLLCKVLKPKKILDLLSASGIRALRLKHNLPTSEVTSNDRTSKACKLITQNSKLNNLNLLIENKDAFQLLSEKKSYDYIDIDPFGTPVPFLDSAVKVLKNNSILAVTATDTSALAGTYPKACLRKYTSLSKKTELMHETGIRILIKKVQEVAAQYDLALTPIFSHSTQHYMRIYLKAKHGAKLADKILSQHLFLEHNPKTLERAFSKESSKTSFGKMWSGDLWDHTLVKKMLKLAEKEIIDPKTKKLLEVIYFESQSPEPFFWDLHRLAKVHKLTIPRTSVLLEKIRKKKYFAERTHFSPTGIKSNISLKELLKLFRV